MRNNNKISEKMDRWSASSATIHSMGCLESINKERCVHTHCMQEPKQAFLHSWKMFQKQITLFWLLLDNICHYSHICPCETCVTMTLNPIQPQHPFVKLMRVPHLYIGSMNSLEKESSVFLRKILFLLIQKIHTITGINKFFLRWDLQFNCSASLVLL